MIVETDLMTGRLGGRCGRLERRQRRTGLVLGGPRHPEVRRASVCPLTRRQLGRQRLGRFVDRRGFRTVSRQPGAVRGFAVLAGQTADRPLRPIGSRLRNGIGLKVLEVGMIEAANVHATHSARRERTRPSPMGGMESNITVGDALDIMLRPLPLRPEPLTPLSMDVMATDPLAVDTRNTHAARAAALAWAGFDDAMLVRPRGADGSPSGANGFVVKASARMGAGNAECHCGDDSEAGERCNACQLDINLAALDQAGFNVVLDEEDDGDRTYRHFVFVVADTTKAAVLRHVWGKTAEPALLDTDTAHQAIAAVNAAVHDREVGSWERAGITDIAAWKAVTSNAAEAAELVAAGWRVDVPADDLHHPSAWAGRAGRDFATCAVWRDAGMTPAQRDRWRVQADDPALVGRLERAGITPELARTFGLYFASPAGQWDTLIAVHGWLTAHNADTVIVDQIAGHARSPHPAVRQALTDWIAADGTPSGFLAWRRSNAPAGIAARYDRLGIDPITAERLAAVQPVAATEQLAADNFVTRADLVAYTRRHNVFASATEFVIYVTALGLAGADCDTADITDFVAVRSVSHLVHYVAQRACGAGHLEALAAATDAASAAAKLSAASFERRPLLKAKTRTRAAVHGAAPTIWS